MRHLVAGIPIWYASIDFLLLLLILPLPPAPGFFFFHSSTFKTALEAELNGEKPSASLASGTD